MHNNLFVNRMVIYTLNGKVAYDEKFHHGVNIIRGSNSSRKSTITHFLFYVLGAAFNDWVKEAKRCSHVVAEVEMNNAVMTLKRALTYVDKDKKFNKVEPIDIFWGSMESSVTAPASEWQRFGYNTTEHRRSFSNVFFENLSIPIVKGENNITFHQILRLLYVDQESPTSSLFFYEQFDSSLTRETVADLLLGVYRQELYDSKQRVLQLESSLDEIKSEIKVIKRYSQSDILLSPDSIRSIIDDKGKEISDIDEELLQLTEQNKIVRFKENSKLEFEKLNQESIAQRELVKQLDDQIASYKYEIDDSKYFISSLENKNRAIKNSIITRDFLGEFPLDYCPECLARLTAAPQDGHCKLCKERHDDSFGISHARKIEQDITFQINESRQVLQRTERQLLELENRYEVEKSKLTGLQKQVNAALKDVKSVREERIDRMYVEKGYKEGELSQYRTLLETAELYQKLLQTKEGYEAEHTILSEKIKRITNELFKLRESVNKDIEREGLYLLNNDFKRQDDFFQAKEFHIDYSNNIAFISDRDAKYSASSNFYLKTSARFAIFLGSLRNNKMRYPRFIFSDNMEDKGIEEGRAHNFQRIIIQEANKFDVNKFQLIYTTAHIPPELVNSQYCVGEYYTEQNRSLKNV